MIDGQDKLGRIGMDLLDRIEERFPPETQPEVVQTITLAEIAYTDEEGDRCSELVYDWSEDRPVERFGLLHWAYKVMLP